MFLRALRCQPLRVVSRPYSTISQGVQFNGVQYPPDEFTNVRPSILSHLSRNIYLQQNHPIGIVRSLIESHFGSSFIPITALPPIVTPQQNFDELEFPPDHPGRRPSDSYYLNKDWMLRTHTSAHEIQVFRSGIPKWLLSADVYRRDEIDRSHYPVFHQMEGARVVEPSEMEELAKENEELEKSLAAVNIQVEDVSTIGESNPYQKWHNLEHARLVNANLKHSLNSMIYALFGKLATRRGDGPLQIRWIDAYFPWTSPSYEVEVLFDGKWLEILGCGVMQQAALTRSGVPKDRVGWAFGLGLERIAMVLFQIPDIRLFWTTDLRFLNQFKEGTVSQFRPYSKYPNSWKDVSFWLKDRDVHENDVYDTVREVAGSLVEEVKEDCSPKKSAQSEKPKRLRPSVNTTGSMSITPIAALAAHHQPRPRLPFGDARHGNNVPTQSQPKPKPQMPHSAQPQQKPTTDHRPQQKEKQLPEPKKEKVRPPSPPAIIRDHKETLVFHKVGFLGEGGFARVYEAKDAQGVPHAIKVISKADLKTTKNRTKLFAEIKIHKSLNHPNIVKFEECFEDEENVYMVLELCQGGVSPLSSVLDAAFVDDIFGSKSLVDLIRRRKRLTELEAKVLLIQLIGASEWMHNHQVIHRDLKLGNIFLDGRMNVKVGDFGLAALIENPGDRKKTVCGTPNYIAPEVLFDSVNGHSFEVDIWSIGVILYTLVVGKPPFQNKEIKAIYKRIRDNLYEFPADIPLSQDCKSLVAAMLTKDPAQRPPLRDVLEHPFFTAGLIPASIPSSAQDIVPSFRNLTLANSRQNLLAIREAALLREQGSEEDEDAVDSAQAVKSSSPAVISTSAAQQERDFQKAVQPGSPISILLHSAKQPLVVAPRDSENLIKRLTAAREKEIGALTNSKRATTGLKGIHEEKEGETEGMAYLPKQPKEYGRSTVIENQKARIVAQMTATLPSASPAVTEDEGTGRVTRKQSQLSGSTRGSGIPTLKSSVAGVDPNIKLNAFNAAELTLVTAFDCISRGTTFNSPAELKEIPPMPNFLICWVDYSSKYGMGYAMSDGTVASHFNDSTSLIMSPNEQHLEYVVRRGKSGSTYVRKHYDVANRPDDLSDKTRLLGHFSTYLMQKLYGDHPYTYMDKDRTTGMDFVQKYLRLKHAILFKISNDVLQFNFYDHTKLILHHRGHIVAFISKDDELQQFFLSDVIVEGSTTEEQALREKLLLKLKYCRQVLREIRKGEVVQVKATTNASTPAGQGEVDGTDEDAGDLRVEEIGRKPAPSTTSTRMLRGQIR
ncbi:Cell cycle serine/threonine-protein kinase cdc5/MSD2 [Serendipita sp. 399]|nr:Cell cycle serine/threonine-protein kinase cdc5/MSD2 [Serendipita sp. 399]